MQNRSRGRNRLIIAIALALCIAVTLIHRTALKTGRVDPTTSISRHLILTPALSAESAVVTMNQSLFGGWFRGSSLTRDNAAMKAKIARLELQNASLREQSTENERLRQMLALPTRQTWKTRSAEVIAVKPTPLHDTALLVVQNAGMARLQDVLISSNGDLLGQVTQVTGATCDALLLTDPLSSVGARVEAVGRPAASKAVVGVCVGDRSQLLQLVDLPGDSDIQVGDHIVTSGLGGVYPPDISIGSVIDVKTDTGRFLKSATVAPNADFNGIREVFLRQ